MVEVLRIISVVSILGTNRASREGVMQEKRCYKGCENRKKQKSRCEKCKVEAMKREARKQNWLLDRDLRMRIKRDEL